MMKCKKNNVADFSGNCPRRPEEAETETLSLINCVPFAGTSNTVANVIFDVEEDDIPVVLAGSIENFSNDGINVIFARTSGNVTRTVLANSSISFVYDDATAVSVFGFGQAYTGSFKYQATYTIEV